MHPCVSYGSQWVSAGPSVSYRSLWVPWVLVSPIGLYGFHGSLWLSAFLYVFLCLV